MPLGTVKRREGLFIALGETLRHGRGHGECRVEQHKYFVFMMNILRVTTLTTPHCGLPAARVLVSRDWPATAAFDGKMDFKEYLA